MLPAITTHQTVISFRIKITVCLISLLVTCSLYAQSPYTWYVFNIPPYGSDYKGGIGFELVEAYEKAGLGNEIVVANAARWFVDMTNPEKLNFCSSGSWKLPATDHRVYSNSINNTVDYGVAVRPELYEQLNKDLSRARVSIKTIIEHTKTAGHLIIMHGRPVFGEMNEIIEHSKQQKDVKIAYMTASEGPLSMLKMATVKSRQVDSVLIFPEEFANFSKENPEHELKYLMLEEGISFAPIRASCPNTESGRQIISKINKLLDEGLRAKALKLFLDALPDMQEIKEQAIRNQHCIKLNQCKDPLIELSKGN